MGKRGGNNSIVSGSQDDIHQLNNLSRTHNSSKSQVTKFKNNSQNRYSNLHLRDAQEDSIFDSSHLLVSHQKSSEKMDKSRSPLQLKHLVDYSNKRCCKFEPKSLKKNFDQISNSKMYRTDSQHLGQNPDIIEKTSPSDLNNRESSSGFRNNGQFVSFRKGGIENAQPVPSQVYAFTPSRENMQPPEPEKPPENPLESMNLNNSLVYLKEKLGSETDSNKINEIKVKIKDMIDFYGT